jgi:hypothetical protein
MKLDSRVHDIIFGTTLSNEQPVTPSSNQSTADQLDGLLSKYKDVSWSETTVNNFIREYTSIIASLPTQMVHMKDLQN